MEKRKHQRVRVNVEGLFMLSGKNSLFRDFSGSIEDISEGGIKIVVKNLSDSPATDSIELGDTIHFTGTDEYVVGKEGKITLVEGDATVVRKEQTDDEVIIGCQFDTLTNSLEEYIKDKKTSSFLVSLQK